MNLETMAGTTNVWGWIVLGYLLGAIPFGYLLVRATGGGDIRFKGSGNIGATNVARTSGWSVGIATLLLDAAKGFLAVRLTEHFSGGNVRFMMYAGLAAILGHVFPVWLRFEGGKGVATALGVFLAVCWPALAADVLLFLLVAVFWRYVSLASISAADPVETGAGIPPLRSRKSCRCRPNQLELPHLGRSSLRSARRD